MMVTTDVFAAAYTHLICKQWLAAGVSQRESCGGFQYTWRYSKRCARTWVELGLLGWGRMNFWACWQASILALPRPNSIPYLALAKEPVKSHPSHCDLDSPQPINCQCEMPHHNGVRRPRQIRGPKIRANVPPMCIAGIGSAVRADFRRLYPANAKTPTCCPSDDNRTKVTNSVTSARSLWWHVGPYFWPADLTRTANAITYSWSSSFLQFCYFERSRAKVAFMTFAS